MKGPIKASISNCFHNDPSFYDFRQDGIFCSSPAELTPRTLTIARLFRRKCRTERTKLVNCQKNLGRRSAVLNSRLNEAISTRMSPNVVTSCCFGGLLARTPSSQTHLLAGFTFAQPRSESPAITQLSSRSVQSNCYRWLRPHSLARSSTIPDTALCGLDILRNASPSCILIQLTVIWNPSSPFPHSFTMSDPTLTARMCATPLSTDELTSVITSPLR